MRGVFLFVATWISKTLNKKNQISEIKYTLVLPSFHSNKKTVKLMVNAKTVTTSNTVLHYFNVKAYFFFYFKIMGIREWKLFQLLMLISKSKLDFGRHLDQLTYYLSCAKFLKLQLFKCITEGILNFRRVISILYMENWKYCIAVRRSWFYFRRK